MGGADRCECCNNMSEIGGALEGNKAQMSSAENYSEIWESNQMLLLNGWRRGNFSKMRHSAGCNKTNNLIHATQHIIFWIARAEALENPQKSTCQNERHASQTPRPDHRFASALPGSCRTEPPHLISHQQTLIKGEFRHLPVEKAHSVGTNLTSRLQIVCWDQNEQHTQGTVAT